MGDRNQILEMYRSIVTKHEAGEDVREAIDSLLGVAWNDLDFSTAEQSTQIRSIVDSYPTLDVFGDTSMFNDFEFVTILLVDMLRGRKMRFVSSSMEHFCNFAMTYRKQLLV